MKEENNILIIASEFPPNVGGIGNHAYHLAKSLASNGFQVHVVADVLDITQKELAAFQLTLSFKFSPVIRTKNLSLTYFRRVAKTITTAYKANYIICSGKFPLWLINALRNVYRHKKIISIVHGSELDLKSKKGSHLITAALKKSNAIISVSSYTESFIDKRVIEKVPCYIIHNGINLSEFNANVSNNRINGLPKLITIGSMTDRKGQENILKAMPEILKSYPKAVYHIIGKPCEKERLQQIVSSLNIASSVVFHDELKRSDLLNVLGNCDIKLMLSNHTNEGDFEGFGIAILEANAMGKPAIGSNFGGITDAIENYKTGILVSPHDPAEISNAIKTILNDYSTYSQNALLWAKQHDWKLIIQQYIKVLQSL